MKGGVAETGYDGYVSTFKYLVWKMSDEHRCKNISIFPLGFPISQQVRMQKKNVL